MFLPAKTYIFTHCSPTHGEDSYDSCPLQSIFNLINLLSPVSQIRGIWTAPTRVTVYLTLKYSLASL